MASPHTPKLLASRVAESSEDKQRKLNHRDTQESQDESQEGQEGQEAKGSMNSSLFSSRQYIARSHAEINIPPRLCYVGVISPTSTG